MSKLALGTVQFGLAYGVANKAGQVSKEEAGKILRMAREAGIDTLDTAIAYGESERVLGELDVDAFKIVTKLPALPDGLSNVEAWIDGQIETSLARLGVKSVYGVLLHRSENLFGEAGHQVIRSLERLKSNGFARKVGVSIYAPGELEQVTQAADIDLVQAPLNLVDRRLEISGWLKRLHAQGTEIHTRSTFLQGLLLMPRRDIPKKFERWSHIWDAWHSSLAECQTTACLSYPLSLPEVDRVVVGVDSVWQLAELIRVSQKKGTHNDLSFMISEDEELINPSQWSQL